MSFRGMWFLVTAGHVVKDVRDKLATGQITMHKWRLNDNFASSGLSDEGVPFDYEGSAKFSECDLGRGLDYGIIQISRHDQRLMEANGIIAVDESRWISQNAVTCDGFMMLGVPEECSAPFTDEFKRTGYTINATLFAIKACERPEDVVEPENAWFVAKIADELPLDSIIGMSGGPIFGFRKEGDQLRYWVWAIQSWWDKCRRIAFGCRVAAFAPMIAEGINRALDNEDDAESAR
jgi:hypothetical protein